MSLLCNNETIILQSKQVFFFILVSGSENLIVPDEVPSLLSLVYSNIPPIRKGKKTDPVYIR